MSEIDLHPYYHIGNLLDYELYIPRCHFVYKDIEVSPDYVIWRDDCRKDPAIISLRHCIHEYFLNLTEAKYSKLPKIAPHIKEWQETNVNYFGQHYFYDLFLKNKNIYPKYDAEWEFEEWCKTAIGEFVVNHYPELLTEAETFLLKEYTPIHCINIVELIVLKNHGHDVRLIDIKR